MNVKCPTCQKICSFDAANTFRPFCSERCQTLDLGAWADECYRVAVDHSADEDENLGVNEKPDSRSVSSETLPPKHHLN